MARTETVIKNSFWAFVNRVTSMLLPFAMRTIIIKILGDQYVGMGSLFTSILGVLNLADLGFTGAIIYNMYRPMAQKDTETLCALLNFYRRIYLIVGTVISGAGMVLLPFLSHLIKGTPPPGMNIYILYLLQLLNTVLEYYVYGYRVSLFYASQRLDIYSRLTLIFRLIQYVTQAIALLTFRNYYAYAIVHTCVVIPQCLYIGYKTKKLFPAYQPRGTITDEQKKNIFTRVYALLGHKIGGTVIFSIDSIIISSFLGLTVLGIYSNYYYILTSVIQITNILLTSSRPAIGNKIVCDSPAEVCLTFHRLSFLWNWIVSLAAVCFLCLYQPFINLWLDSAHLLPMYVVVTIVAYFYFWQFRVVGLSFKDAGGLWREDWLKPYIGMLANLTLSIAVVVLTKDVIGVLIPTICVMLFLYFPWETKVIFRTIFKCSPRKYLGRCLVFLLATCAAGFCTYELCALLPFEGVLPFILRVALCAVVPNAILLLTFFRTDEFKYYVAIAKAKTSGVLSRFKRG